MKQSTVYHLKQFYLTWFHFDKHVVSFMDVNVASHPVIIPGGWYLKSQKPTEF